MNGYLYGARDDDPRYRQAFLDKYATAGPKFLNDVKSSYTSSNVKNSLFSIMQKGRTNAENLAKHQAQKMDYNSIDEFTKDFNKLINNFEEIIYTMLDQIAVKVSYDWYMKSLEGFKEAPISDETTVIPSIKEQERIERALEKSIDGSIEEFWNNASGILSNDKHMNKALKELVNSRAKEFFTEDMLRYNRKYAGDLGELTGAMMLKALSKSKIILATKIQMQIRDKGRKTRIMGKELTEAGVQGKGDVIMGELVFSIKNYTQLRERFKDIQSRSLKDAFTGEKKSIDINFQKTGTIQNVLNNFAADTNLNLLKGKNERVFTYIMNALYFNQYGEEAEYQIATQALDILVNTYAYVYLMQGTTKNLGYQIQHLDEVKNPLPGYLWMTGVGVVPMFKILDLIKDSFVELLSRTRNQGRTSTHAILSFSNYESTIEQLEWTKERSVYPENSLSRDGRYYRRSKKYSIPVTPETTLTKRYAAFSNSVQTTVKLHIKLETLFELIK